MPTLDKLNDLLDLIGDRYTLEEIVELLNIETYDLVWMYRDEIFDTIRDTGEFGEDELVSEMLQGLGIRTPEEEPDEE